MENDESTTATVLPKVALENTEDGATLATLAGEQAILNLKDSDSITTHQNEKGDDEGLTEERGGKDGQEGTSTAEVEKPAESQTTSSTAAPSTTSYVPPVKRFNAVNINKKFLEKASSGSSAGAILTTSGVSKQIGSIGVSYSRFSLCCAEHGSILAIAARPSPQSTSSNSRLITSKLSGAAASTTPAAGWSRPSSATPPAPLPTSRTNSAGGPGASSTLHTLGANSAQASGRPVLKQQKNEDLRSSARPAWRSVVAKPDIRPSHDFPTAAEAAQGELW